MMYPFADVSIYNIYIILIFAIIASAIMSLIGTISGIWAEKWDHLGTVGNFVIVPCLSFWYILFDNCVTRTHSNGKFNKSIFYMIDGFRYGFFGVSDSSYLSAIFILLVIFIFLIAINYLMLKSGYKLRP